MEDVIENVIPFILYDMDLWAEVDVLALRNDHVERVKDLDGQMIWGGVAQYSPSVSHEDTEAEASSSSSGRPP